MSKSSNPYPVTVSKEIISKKSVLKFGFAILIVVA